ncbi:MAG: hypothetical protein KatS3mg076_0302 [Candidatus Binatia bacterium]|nr:MAG: hypothetical protein KatS3mg076_0302 [Candidatus Binatia bacterium]
MSVPAGCSGSPRLRVCFFGTYAREHTVTRVLLSRLSLAGCDVLERHVPLWERTRDKDASYFAPASLGRLLPSYLGAAVSLLRTLPRAGETDVYCVGFQGPLDVVLLRAARPRAKIVFFPLVTLTETLLEDRGVYGPRSLWARLVRALDGISLRAATTVVFDTRVHAEDVCRSFSLEPRRVRTWYLGADLEVFERRVPPKRKGSVNVLFYGQFLPLHGLDTILDAFERLLSRPGYECRVVGTGPERRRLEPRLRDLEGRGLRWTEWVAYGDLGREVAGADVVLGCFGNSRKASLVVPNKVYQAAAVGRPIVTRDGPAIREIFRPGDDLLAVPPNDPASLFEALLELGDEARRRQLGDEAGRLFETTLAPGLQARRLRQILEETCVG